jgi:hypothetical protein
MKAMILAAGQGMHLRLLTEHMPKCMIPAGGKPVLEHTFEYHHIRGRCIISAIRDNRLLTTGNSERVNRGNGAPERREPSADRDRDRGSLSLSEIAVGMRREARVLGEVIATKPAWKRRRASENDDEVLQLLADGLGQWIAHHQPHGS